MYIQKLLLFVFLSAAQALFAQNKDVLQDMSQASLSGGQIIMSQDTLLSHLITLQQQVYKQNGKMVFRVQLFRGNNMQTSREEAAVVKSKFLDKYPNEEVFTVFDSPYWKVRVGTFETYGDALKLRTKLEKELAEIKEDISIVNTTVSN